jgi:diguanylate cyclase (GGDEF)-like protein
MISRAAADEPEVAVSLRATARHWTVRPLYKVPMGSIVAGYLALYVAGAWWGKQLMDGPATPWYPPPGLTVVLVIAFGVRLAPLAAITEVVSSIVVFNVDATFTPVQIGVNAVVIAVGLSVGPAWLRARIGNGPGLRDPQVQWLFMLTCVLGGPALTALAGIGIREWADAMAGQTYWQGVRTWFLGDALGVVTVAPLTLVLLLKGPAVRRLFSRRFVLELAGLVGFAGAMLMVEGSGPRPAYLTLIPLIAIAYRHGLVGATFAAAAVNLTFVLAGQFVLTEGQFEKIQGLIVVMSMGALITGSLAAHDRRAQRRATEAAASDHVSGLASRSRLLSWLSEAMGDDMKRARTTLLIVDIDRFGAVNDVWGQDVGDRLLRLLAERLAEVVRYDARCARFGSDEFAVLLDGDPAAAYPVAEQILAAMAMPFHVNGEPISIQVHIGIASARDLEHPSDVVRGASLALQPAAEDRRRIVALDADLWDQSTRDQALENDLPEAIETGQLYLVYQPILWLEERSHESCEALLRWSHPTFGGVPPPVIVELAQRAGLMRRVTDFVTSEASRQVGAWRALGRDVIVEVNITAADLFSPGFADRAAVLVTGAGIDSSGIVFELTEESAIADLEQAQAVMHELRAHGFALAIDDFGTGYASLTYLESLPVDILKLDRVFVAHLTGDSRSDAIVRAVIPLAHELGLVVVAEGIEHQQQLNILEELGCDAIQGFLLGTPRVAAEYEPLSGVSGALDTATA